MSKNNPKRLAPPDDLTRVGMLEWFEISLALFGVDSYDEDLLPKVNKLARLKEQQVTLLNELQLKPRPSTPESTGFQRNLDHIHLADPEEFDKRFEYYSPKYDTYPEAWERVEWEHRQTFGKNKYSSYDSYRNARKKRINT